MQLVQMLVRGRSRVPMSLLALTPMSLTPAELLQE